MNVVCLGLSHQSAPVAVRERVALDADGGAALLRALVEGPGAAAVEAVALSTCNRTEVYLAGGDAAALRPAALAALADVTGVAAADIETHLYDHAGPAAVRHLLSVAAGLDSMILGEAQILGQVRTAAAAARATGTLDTVLGQLFRSAVRAGRRARVETEINARAASIPSAAVEVAGRALAELQAERPPAGPRVVVVIGAGKMAVLAATAFGKDGGTHIVVTNRDYRRAMALARQWQGCAVTFDQLGDAVGRADIVIASTSAPHAVLTRDDVAAAMARRPDRPLVIVDIAVPRDVEPAARDVPNVRLLDVDDLAGTVATNLAERAAAVPRVRAIVEDEAARFERWLAAADVTPTIAALRQWADEVRGAELARALRRLEALGPREREAVQALSVALVGKLLHAPVARLKAGAGSAEATRLALALRALFGLAEPDEADEDGADPTPAPPLAAWLPAAATLSVDAQPGSDARSDARPPRPRDAR